jgi:hypothetical protein
VDQTSGTTPTAAPADEQSNGSPPAPALEANGFQSRGRARRRARFLRKARELAYRDLGGLVFNLHRFGQRNDPLVVAKLATLDHLDAELRSIETSLGERQPITVLREAGITACPRCAAIHSSEDNFCPNCGMAMGRHADLPAGFQSAPATVAPPPPAPVAPPAGATTPPPPTPAPQAPPPAAGARRQSPPPPGTGRSPVPPSTAAAPTPQEADSPTEIIRPPDSGA